MLKRLFLSFLFVSPLWAVDNVIGPYSGLQNADNSATIPAERAQDLLNVDLSLGGKSVKKREGYGLAYALAITTSPVHGVHSFYDASGNSNALAFNDTRMTASVNGGSATVLFSTGPSGATYQCTDSQGFAYCTNTSRNNVIKTDGQTYSFLIPASTGTMVTVTPDRLVLAGFSNTPNRVDFSAAADFTTWATGVAPTSAFNFTITAPGSHITHITYAFNRVMWFKDASFGFILQGQTAADWVVQTVSPNIGTLDNSSVFDKGILYFRAQDAHIYAYDGANLTKLSRDIGGTISASQSRASNSWTQTTAADFNAGFISNLDSTTSSGNLTLSLSTAGTRIYGSAAISAYIGACYSVALSSYVAQQFTPATSGYILTSFAAQLRRTGSPTGTLLAEVLGDNGANHPNTTIYASTSMASVAAVSTLGAGTTFYLNTPLNVAGNSKYWMRFYQNSGSCDASNVIAVGLDQSNSFNGQYAEASSLPTTNTAHFFHVVNGQIYVSSGTYSSAVKNATALASWDTFAGSYVSNISSVSFSIRSSTNSIQITSSTPSWTSINSGAVPSISTGTFFQVRIVIISTVGYASPTFNDFTQNWFEGSAADKSYCAYFKDAVWFSVTSGTGATVNNAILRYDLLNQTWLIYDLPVNGFYTRGVDLYFGSSTSGNVFKFGNSTDDNGSAINAYWKSKDFFMESPFTDSDITTLSVFFKAVNSSSMTVTYNVNGSSSSTAYTVPLQRNGPVFGRCNRNLPQGTSGNTFNIQFGNNAVAQPFEVLAISFGATEKGWSPGQ